MLQIAAISVTFPANKPRCPSSFWLCHQDEFGFPHLRFFVGVGSCLLFLRVCSSAYFCRQKGASLRNVLDFCFGLLCRRDVFVVGNPRLDAKVVRLQREFRSISTTKSTNPRTGAITYSYKMGKVLAERNSREFETKYIDSGARAKEQTDRTSRTRAHGPPVGNAVCSKRWETFPASRPVVYSCCLWCSDLGLTRGTMVRNFFQRTREEQPA